MLSYAQHSQFHRACSRRDANRDQQMTHRRRCTIPWAGSGRHRRPAPAVTRPRSPPPPAHYHSTRVQRRSPPLPCRRQPPPSRRAVHGLGPHAANGCRRRTRPYLPFGQRRNGYLGQGRGASKRWSELLLLRDPVVQSRGGLLRCQQGDAHGYSQISLVRGPPLVSVSKTLKERGPRRPLEAPFALPPSHARFRHSEECPKTPRPWLASAVHVGGGRRPRNRWLRVELRKER